MSTEKVFRVSLVFFSILFIAATTAFADPVGVQFVGVGGQNQNGYYTYPYFISLNKDTQQPMICDDFYDNVSVGDNWHATITDLSSGDVSRTMFNDLTKYEEAAYLLLQIKSYNMDQWGNINWAVWKIFDPEIDPGYQYEQGVNYWLQQAETADLSKVDFSGVKILTPTSAGPQEFLYITPEPGTLFLLGTGALTLWSRRKRLF